MLHQKLYRNIHKAIIEHQHSIWLQRNSEAHPPDEVPVIIIRDKKRKHIHQPLDIESDTTNDAWIADRENSLIIQEMWQGIPAPKRQKQAPLREVVEVEEKGWGKGRPEEEIDVGMQWVRAISTTTDISGTTVVNPLPPVSVQNIARNGTEWHGIREFHGSVPFRAIPCLHFFYFFDFFIKMGSPMNFKGTYRSKKCIGVLTALYG